MLRLFHDVAYTVAARSKCTRVMHHVT